MTNGRYWVLLGCTAVILLKRLKSVTFRCQDMAHVVNEHSRCQSRIVHLNAQHPVLQTIRRHSR